MALVLVRLGFDSCRLFPAVIAPPYRACFVRLELHAGDRPIVPVDSRLLWFSMHGFAAVDGNDHVPGVRAWRGRHQTSCSFSGVDTGHILLPWRRAWMGRKRGGANFFLKRRLVFVEAM